MQSSNNETKVFAQIETVSGVKNIKDILSAEGVNGCFIGPNDLSCDYGCIGEESSNKILSTIEDVANVCKMLNKSSGIITHNSSYIKKAKESQLQFFCVGSELSILKSAGKDIINYILD